jgi:hypothetical protein
VKAHPLKNQLTGEVLGWVRVGWDDEEGTNALIYLRDGLVVPEDELTDEHLGHLYETQDEALTAGIDKLQLAHREWDTRHDSTVTRLDEHDGRRARLLRRVQEEGTA